MELLEWYIGLILVGLLLNLPHFFLPNQYKKEHQITFMILLLASLLEAYGTYTAIHKINNTFAYNLFFVYLETILILSFFYNFFKKQKNVRFAITFGSCIFLVWGVIYSLFFQNLSTFHTYSFSFGSLMIILCCIYFFIFIFLKDWFIDEKLAFNPLFWITTCIFLFYTSTFLYFSSITFLVDLDRNLVFILSAISRIMAVILYLGMGLAFYLPYLKKSVQKA